MMNQVADCSALATCVLKNEVRDDDLQKLMLAVIQPAEEEEGEIDVKSTGSGAGKG